MDVMAVACEGHIGSREGLPYKLSRVQALIRSNAFSMFSIELATLNRK